MSTLVEQHCVVVIGRAIDHHNAPCGSSDDGHLGQQCFGLESADLHPVERHEVADVDIGHQAVVADRRDPAFSGLLHHGAGSGRIHRIQDQDVDACRDEIVELRSLSRFVATGIHRRDAALRAQLPHLLLEGGTILGLIPRRRQLGEHEPNVRRRLLRRSAGTGHQSQQQEHHDR